METEERIKLLIDLWKAENPIKTSKLVIFFLATSILASALDITSPVGWLVPTLGMCFSFVWYFCIGRTVAFQDIWEQKTKATIEQLPIHEKGAYDIFPSLEEKAAIPLYGKMKARYILLWPPIAGFLLWFAVLLFYLGGRYYSVATG